MFNIENIPMAVKNLLLFVICITYFYKKVKGKK